jgi:integrase
MPKRSIRLSTKSLLKKWILKQSKTNEPAMNISLLRHSLRESTLSQYERIKNLYEIILFEHETPFPLTFLKLCRFIRGLSTCNISSKTVAKYVSSLKTLNIINGYENLSKQDNDLVNRAIKAVKKLKPDNIKRQANVLTSQQLKIIMGAKCTNKMSTAYKLGFRLCLRAGEVIKLGYNDILLVTLKNKMAIKIALRCTKVTNTTVFKYLSCECSESHGAICLAHEVLKLSDLKRREQAPNLFGFSSTVDLTKHLRIFLKKVFKFPSWYLKGFSGHTLRRSGAQSMKDKGFSDFEIMQECRWKSKAMLPLYLR